MSLRFGILFGVFFGLPYLGALIVGLRDCAERRWRWWATMTALAVGFIAWLTWMPSNKPPAWFGYPTLAECLDGSWGTYGRAGLIADVIPNVALYVPLGCAVMLWSRRWWLAAPLCIALTVSSEVLQALSGSRTCSKNDMVTNTVGGLIGILLASLLLLWLRRRDARAASWPGLHGA